MKHLSLFVLLAGSVFFDGIYAQDYVLAPQKKVVNASTKLKPWQLPHGWPFKGSRMSSFIAYQAPLTPEQLSALYSNNRNRPFTYSRKQISKKAYKQNKQSIAKRSKSKIKNQSPVKWKSPKKVSFLPTFAPQVKQKKHKAFKKRRKVIRKKVRVAKRKKVLKYIPAPKRKKEYIHFRLPGTVGDVNNIDNEDIDVKQAEKFVKEFRPQ